MASSMHGTPQVQCNTLTMNKPPQRWPACMGPHNYSVVPQNDSLPASQLGARPGRQTSACILSCSRRWAYCVCVHIVSAYVRVCVYITASNARQPGSVKSLECPTPVVRHIGIITGLPLGRPTCTAFRVLPPRIYAMHGHMHAQHAACWCKWHAACSACTAQQRSTPQW
jgi:hypothetical protein